MENEIKKTRGRPKMLYKKSAFLHMRINPDDKKEMILMAQRQNKSVARLITDIFRDVVFVEMGVLKVKERINDKN